MENKNIQEKDRESSKEKKILLRIPSRQPLWGSQWPHGRRFWVAASTHVTLFATCPPPLDKSPTLHYSSVLTTTSLPNPPTPHPHAWHTPTFAPWHCGLRRTRGHWEWREERKRKQVGTENHHGRWRRQVFGTKAVFLRPCSQLLFSIFTFHLLW